MKFHKKGFTMVELIIVIAIIGVLAAIIFVAVDPARRIHEARNARRQSDANTIVDSLLKFQADNDGTHYTTVAAATAGTYYVIGTAAAGCNTTCTAQPGTAGACLDLTGLPTNYLATVPLDPQSGTAANTDYYLLKGANGNLTVGACDTEGEAGGGGGTLPVISVTR